MQEAKFKESWNKKRIIIAIISLLLLMVLGYFFTGGFFTGKLKNKLALSSSQSPSGKSVLSAQSEPNFPKAFQKQIESIKNEAGNINIDEIASSSPQIQKIINDIKSLENLPRSQVKDVCFKFCSGL